MERSLSALLSVEEARGRICDGVGPVATERVALRDAAGRVLAEPVLATRDQPPFDASAMDGWAICSARALSGPATLPIVGESAAGRPFSGVVEDEQAVRIFTGAPVPAGCGWVVPQEAARRNGDTVTLGPFDEGSSYIRSKGGDFRTGSRLLAAGARIDAWRVALAAAAGASLVCVAARPRLTLITTGEELVLIGSGRTPSADQIFDSGSPALAAWAEALGGDVEAIHHARDDEGAIAGAVQATSSPLIVFIGGASVGDYDLVKPALTRRFGLSIEIEGVNVRPGKPTWFGRLGDGRRALGLPGNPASALVCAELFLRPLLLALQGAPAEPALSTARLGHDLPANGPREHWMRAQLSIDADGLQCVRAMSDQDSSLVTVFAGADALLRREPNAEKAEAGAAVQVLRLDRL